MYLKNQSSQESRFGEKPATPTVSLNQAMLTKSKKRFRSVVPCNLLVLALPRLHRQAHLVHFVHVACGLHVGEDVVLQLGDGLQGIRDVLVLLDVADDFGSFGALGEVDEVGLFDQGGDAVFDEG